MACRRCRAHCTLECSYIGTCRIERGRTAVCFATPVRHRLLLTRFSRHRQHATVSPFLEIPVAFCLMRAPLVTFCMLPRHRPSAVAQHSCTPPTKPTQPDLRYSTNSPCMRYLERLWRVHHRAESCYPGQVSRAMTTRILSLSTLALPVTSRG